MKAYLIIPSEDFKPSQRQIDEIKKVCDVEIVFHTGKLSGIDALLKDDSEKIIAVDPNSFEWDLDAETISKIPNVVGVCPSSTSFDWVKPKELKDMGVTVCNAPGFSTDSVAEYAVCMAIELARQMPIVIKNNWEPADQSKSFSLKSKTAGVVGLGRIGSRMAEILQGIGMNVVYYSENSTSNAYKKVDLETLFREADLVMPALAENDETKKLITNELIDTMKRTAIFVGINRVKAIWDEEYIIQKVGAGEIAGYAFEGDNSEPPEKYEGNVWALPPIAWMTQDSLDNLMQIWTDNIVALAEGRPQNVVN